jgi:outer membrane protein, heavy metal efflux system
MSCRARRDPRRAAFASSDLRVYTVPFVTPSGRIWRRLPRALISVTIALAACAPSRATLFGPVSDAAKERTGITPEWRSGWQRSPASDERVRQILARPLDAEGAAMVAVLSSAELQAAYSELAGAGGALAGARSLPNPELEAELRFDDGERQIELSAIQSLTGLLAILPRLNGANAELRAARRSAVAMTVAVASRARIALHRAAAAEHRLRLRRTIAEAAVASATLARSLHAAGNITDLDLTRETVFEEEAKLAVREAETRASTAREEVNAALGLHGAETGWRLAGAPPSPPEKIPAHAELERDAVTASLDLEALRWRIEAAGHRIGLARLDSFLPDLGVGVAANREGDWSVGPAVTLSIPIFDWGTGARATAWADLRRLQHEYTAAAVAVRAAARSARDRLVAAHEIALRMRTVVLPMRERLVDEALRQYNAMNLDAFELLIVRREHIEAEERYVEALREYWIAQTEVDQLRAGSMPAGPARRE